VSTKLIYTVHFQITEVYSDVSTKLIFELRYQSPQSGISEKKKTISEGNHSQLKYFYASTQTDIYT